jgi:hypothetical protein
MREACPEGSQGMRLERRKVIGWRTPFIKAAKV